MSTVIKDELSLVKENLRTGPMPKDFTWDKFTDPSLMIEFLYRSQDLTDEYYEEMIDNIGSRAARLVLRAKAVSGDVKAIDLYDRIVQRDKKARAERTKPAERTVSSSPFLQTERVKDADPK